MSDPTPFSKAGWKTSEHWLVALASAAAIIVPLVVDPVTWQHIVSILGAVAAALGYTHLRTSHKGKDLERDALLRGLSDELLGGERDPHDVSGS